MIHAKILIIEDDNSFRKTLIKSLNSEGYFVYGTADGDSALEIAKTHPPFDVIIADVRLPGKRDGVETIARIKDIYSDKVGAIVITGYNNTNAYERAMKLEVDDYIKKPFELEEFLNSVRRSVEKIQKGRNRL